MTTQQVPYSQESEESVLGAVLTNPLAYLNISAFLKSDDFYFTRHGWLWDAFGRLANKDEPIDTVTVSEELQAYGQLAEFGGPAYLTHLIRNTPTSAHAEIYGKLVERASKRRKVMIACDEIKLMATDETISWEQVAEKAEGKILSATVAESHQKPTDIESVSHEYMSNVEALIKQNEQGISPGLPTGFPSVDNIIRGSYKGELTVIAGPPKSGKTTYNLNVARNRAKMGANIVIFTCEMDSNALMRKFISMETGIPVETLQDAKFTPQQYSLFVEASSKVSRWRMHIIDKYPSPTPLDIRRELRRIMHKESVDCVLIDGLWLMRSTVPTDNEPLNITNIMKALAAAATKLNIPIDIVHQTNRQAAGRPNLSNLKGSSGIEENAYKIIFLYRPGYYSHDSEDNETEIIVAANRNGNTGSRTLGFDKGKEMYHELESSSTNQHYTPPQQRQVDIDATRKDLH